MPLPSIENLLGDRKKKITYRILAFRKLSHQEKVLILGSALGQMDKKDRPKRNYIHTIVTVIGNPESN